MTINSATSPEEAEAIGESRGISVDTVLVFEDDSSAIEEEEDEAAEDDHEALERLAGKRYEDLAEVVFPSALPSSVKRFAVIDFETTGLGWKSARVTEVGLVVVDENGAVVREFETIVNPTLGAEIDAQLLTGLTPSIVRQAPVFSDIVDSLIEALEGCVAMVAHNKSFDKKVLRAEFARLGLAFDNVPWHCTCDLSQRKSLEDACGLHHIQIASTHTAIADARACAELFLRIVEKNSDLQREIGRHCPLNVTVPGLSVNRRAFSRADLAKKSAGDAMPAIVKGEHVCFTSLPASVKDDLKQLAESVGLVALESLLKRPKFVALVAPDPSSRDTEKLRTAAERGIPIVTEHTFREAVRRHLEDKGGLGARPCH